MPCRARHPRLTWHLPVPGRTWGLCPCALGPECSTLRLGGRGGAWRAGCNGRYHHGGAAQGAEPEPRRAESRNRVGPAEPAGCRAGRSVRAELAVGPDAPPRSRGGKDRGPASALALGGFGRLPASPRGHMGAWTRGRTRSSAGAGVRGRHPPVSLPHPRSWSPCSVRAGSRHWQGRPPWGAMAPGNRSPGLAGAWVCEPRKERNPEGSGAREVCWGQEAWGPGEPEHWCISGSPAQEWS